jgi:sulfur-oxidizing protein SoxY
MHASRRSFLISASRLAGVFGLASMLPVGRAAVAQAPAQPPAALQEAIRKAIGQAQVQTGKVTLDLPPLVENGNAVSLGVAVDSPMSAADHVKAIHLFTEKNPQPNVASFRLGPRAGRASVSTRIRLADSQEIIAIAEMSDGSFWSARTHVVVTLAACLEEG